MWGKGSSSAWPGELANGLCCAVLLFSRLHPCLQANNCFKSLSMLGWCLKSVQVHAPMCSACCQQLLVRVRCVTRVRRNPDAERCCKRHVSWPLTRRPPMSTAQQTRSFSRASASLLLDKLAATLVVCCSSSRTGGCGQRFSASKRLWLVLVTDSMSWLLTVSSHAHKQTSRHFL